MAHAKELATQELVERYEKLLLEAMALKSSPAKHVNVLHHMLGYFRKNISAHEKRELIEVIDEYRRAVTPLIVPVTLINHYVRKYGEPYLKNQIYLNPNRGAAVPQPCIAEAVPFRKGLDKRAGLGYEWLLLVRKRSKRAWPRP